MPSRGDSGIVLISEGLYRLLLGLYPRSYREEWAADMSRTFHDHAREQFERDGIVGLMGLLVFTVFDVIKTALEETVQRGDWFMSKEQQMNLGGRAISAAGIMLMLGSLDSFTSVTYLLLGLSLFGQFVGFLALNAFASRSSTTVRGAILITTAASAASIVGYFVAYAAFVQYLGEAYFNLFIHTITALFTCELVLGILLSRRPILPRRGERFLLLTLPAVGFMMVTSYFSLTRSDTSLKDPAWVISIIAFMCAGLGLILFGNAMVPSKSPIQPETA